MRSKPKSDGVPPRRTPLTTAQRTALGKQRPPSKASLREMPEIDFATGFVRRGPDGLREVLAHARAKLGRPKKGETRDPALTRTLRLTQTTWQALEQRAEKQGTTVHALLREAVEDLLHKAS